MDVLGVEAADKEERAQQEQTSGVHDGRL
jgi:hypothetical protein